MNISKMILSTAIAAVLASTAGAVDNTATIDITGATAFRASTHTSILAVLSGETYAYTGPTLSNATQAIFKGTLNGTPVIVRTSFSGSAAGVGALASGSNVNFLSTVEGTVPTSGGGTSGTTPGVDAASADLALSDVAQSSTNFQSPTLVGSPVAIVPFKFVASQGANTVGITNVTNQLFRTLWANGTVPLSLWTGNPDHEENLVIATGRDGGSGTRIVTLAETRYGINKQVVQFTGTVASDVVTDIAEVGNGGYSSGGTSNGMALLLGADSFTNFGSYFVGYLGLPDATAATGLGAVELSYNGFFYSPAAVYNGTYTFWGYEYLYSLTASPGNNVGALKTALTNAIAADPGAAGLDPSLMRVVRDSDGGDVNTNFN